MLQKQTWLFINDNTNVTWIQLFHLYKGFYRRQTKLGFFVKGSAKIVVPPRVEYKGFKFKTFYKGHILRALVVRNVYAVQRLDGGVLHSFQNTAIILKKKQDTQSKYFFGPAIRTLNRKRFLLLFNHII